MQSYATDNLDPPYYLRHASSPIGEVAWTCVFVGKCSRMIPSTPISKRYSNNTAINAKATIVTGQRSLFRSNFVIIVHPWRPQISIAVDNFPVSVNKIRQETYRHRYGFTPIHP